MPTPAQISHALDMEVGAASEFSLEGFACAVLLRIVARNGCFCSRWEGNGEIKG